jgi:hypothetical protein
MPSALLGRLKSACVADCLAAGCADGGRLSANDCASALVWRCIVAARRPRPMHRARRGETLSFAVNARPLVLKEAQQLLFGNATVLVEAGPLPTAHVCGDGLTLGELALCIRDAKGKATKASVCKEMAFLQAHAEASGRFCRWNCLPIDGKAVMLDWSGGSVLSGLGGFGGQQPSWSEPLLGAKVVLPYVFAWMADGATDGLTAFVNVPGDESEAVLALLSALMERLGET